MDKFNSHVLKTSLPIQVWCMSARLRHLFSHCLVAHKTTCKSETDLAFSSVERWPIALWNDSFCQIRSKNKEAYADFLRTFVGANTRIDSSAMWWMHATQPSAKTTLPTLPPCSSFWEYCSVSQDNHYCLLHWFSYFFWNAQAGLPVGYLPAYMPAHVYIFFVAAVKVH